MAWRQQEAGQIASVEVRWCTAEQLAANNNAGLCGCMAELTAPTLSIGNSFAFLRNGGEVTGRPTATARAPRRLGERNMADDRPPSEFSNARKRRVLLGKLEPQREAGRRLGAGSGLWFEGSSSECSVFRTGRTRRRRGGRPQVAETSTPSQA